MKHKLEKRFQVGRIEQMGPELLVIVGPKGGKPKPTPMDMVKAGA